MTTPRPSHAPAGAFVAAACAMLLAAAGLLYCGTGCTHRADGSLVLTPSAEAGIVIAELDLCDVFEPMAAAALPQPLAGAAVVLGPAACAGQSAAFKAALDKVTALPAPDGGIVAQSAAPLAFPIIHTRRGYPVWHRGAHLGYVPTAAQARAIASPQIQLFLDTLGKDGGR